MSSCIYTTAPVAYRVTIAYRELVCNLKRGSLLSQGHCPAPGFTARDREQAGLQPSLTSTARCTELFTEPCVWRPRGRREEEGPRVTLGSGLLPGGRWCCYRDRDIWRRNSRHGGTLSQGHFGYKWQEPNVNKVKPCRGCVGRTKGHSHKGAGLQAPQHPWALRGGTGAPLALWHNPFLPSLSPGPYWFSAATQESYLTI